MGCIEGTFLGDVRWHKFNIRSMRLLVLLLFGTLSYSATRFESRLHVTVHTIENTDRFSLYTLYKYDSKKVGDQIISKYVFHERSDSFRLEIGQQYQLKVTKQSPCLFARGADTMSFCRSCRVIFSDVFMGYQYIERRNRRDSIPVIGEFHKIEAVLK